MSRSQLATRADRLLRVFKAHAGKPISRSQLKEEVGVSSILDEINYLRRRGHVIINVEAASRRNNNNSWWIYNPEVQEQRAGETGPALN